MTRTYPANGVPRLIVASPGNGTRYVLMITPVTDEGACAELGCAPGSAVVALWPGARMSASAIFRGADGGYLAPQYVAEKLDVPMTDAVPLASILAKGLGRD